MRDDRRDEGKIEMDECVSGVRRDVGPAGWAWAAVPLDLLSNVALIR